MGTEWCVKSIFRYQMSTANIIFNGLFNEIFFCYEQKRQQKAIYVITKMVI